MKKNKTYKVKLRFQSHEVYAESNEDYKTTLSYALEYLADTLNKDEGIEVFFPVLSSSITKTGLLLITRKNRSEFIPTDRLWVFVK